MTYSTITRENVLAGIETYHDIDMNLVHTQEANRRLARLGRVDKFSSRLTSMWMIFRTLHTFGRRATVWTSQLTTVMISAMSFGPGLHPCSPTARAGVDVLPVTTGALSMPSCGLCAREHPGVIFLQTMGMEQCFCEISQTCQRRLLDRNGKTVLRLPRF